MKIVRKKVSYERRTKEIVLTNRGDGNGHEPMGISYHHGGSITLYSTGALVEHQYKIDITADEVARIVKMATEGFTR